MQDIRNDREFDVQIQNVRDDAGNPANIDFQDIAPSWTISDPNIAEISASDATTATVRLLGPLGPFNLQYVADGDPDAGEQRLFAVTKEFNAVSGDAVAADMVVTDERDQAPASPEVS